MSKKFEDYGDVLNPMDVRDLLGIGNNKIYELLCSGEIPSFKIGRNRKILKRCVIEYLDAQFKEQEECI